MSKTVFENWEYHPALGTDSRLITTTKYNSKGEPVSCFSCLREYRKHTI